MSAPLEPTQQHTQAPSSCLHGAGRAAAGATPPALMGLAPTLRRLAYAVAMVLAVAVALQCGLAMRAHDKSRSHQELLSQALDLPQAVLALGRQAALLALWPQARERHRHQFKHMLAEADLNAQTLPTQWAALQSQTLPEHREVNQAMETWQQATLRLQAHGHALAAARTTAAAPGAAAFAASEATSVEAQLQLLQARFQAEVEPAMEAAQTLLATLQRVNRSKLNGLQEDLMTGALALLLLVAALSLGVAEPTARWIARRALRLAESSVEAQRLALVAEHTNALVVMSDADDRIVWVNDAFSEVTGFAAQDVIGRNTLEVMQHPSADPALLLQVQQAITAGQGTRLEGMHKGQSGQDLWLDIDLRALHDEERRLTGFVRVASDDTERYRLQEQVREHARSDALTALPNRAVVMERLQAAIAHAQRHADAGFAVLFMDFDRFKQVNDTLGHGAGDELLRQIAVRLTRSIRHSDGVARVPGSKSLAARLGGDEFVVVLDRIDGAEVVEPVAQRLLNELAQPYLLGPTPVHSSASIGVVLVNGRQDPQLLAAMTAQDVLRDADTAMYEAKRAGRGRWILFDASMREKLVRSLALEQDLRLALEQDQLTVVYQPVVDLATRRMTGVEALARWQHPVRGMVPPLDFIPVAEESGLIDAVGASVLRKACTQFVAWRKRLGGLAPRQLAVNLSRAQLKSAALVGDVRALLQDTAMQPQWLQLEVTESLAAQDDLVQGALRELKELGVKLALDDFGTGYSSLACLHLMPVDTVKIDRSFVKHAETVEYHRVLIEATIRVARTLGMTTVAEGIETEGQATLMLELECDRGQGYLYSRPVTGEAIEALAEAEHQALT